MCQQQGELAEAQRLCLGILESSPDHFDAKHLLAIVRHQQGHATEAIDLLAAALARKPAAASALSNYALMLYEAGRHEDALASIERALAIRPDFADALCHRGAVLVALERHEAALASYDKALAIFPGNPEALNRRGAALSALERHAEALASYDKALAIVPGFVQALNNRGTALTALKRHDEALASYDKALAITPDYPEAHYNSAVALDELRRHKEALASCDRALVIRPDYPEALNNRGIALDELGRHEEALTSYQRALAIRPDYAEALNNRGTCLDGARTFRGGARELRRSARDPARIRRVPLEQEPAAASARILRVRLGGIRMAAKTRGVGAPAFRGAGMDGGLDREARAALCGAGTRRHDPVRPLCALARRGRQGRHPGGPAAAARAFALACRRDGDPQGRSAARLRRPPAAHERAARAARTAEGLPAQVPYLAADPDRTARWAARLRRDGSFKVGIAWQGNPKAPGDKGRSIPLAAFAPLGRVPGVTFVSLQKHDGVEQLADLPGGMTVETLGNDFDAGPDAFLDTAAVMMALDLVISSDTAMAHLAGALARPVWIPLKQVPDWRWMARRENTPWYPTVRLFRQCRRDDWDEVFARMASELARLVRSGTTSDSHTTEANGSTGDAVLVPVSFGELIDKMTILEIKAQRMQDPAKIANVRNELALLTAARARFSICGHAVDRLKAELTQTNEALWDIEDRIRDCERDKNFGAEFVELARSVYRTNDRRAALKRQINELAGSPIVEEKSYRGYT